MAAGIALGAHVWREVAACPRAPAVTSTYHGPPRLRPLAYEAVRRALKRRDALVALAVPYASGGFWPFQVGKSSHDRSQGDKGAESFLPTRFISLIKDSAPFSHQRAHTHLWVKDVDRIDLFT